MTTTASALDGVKHTKLIRPEPLSFEDFPKSKASTEGMLTIKADNSDPEISSFLAVKYATKSGVPLHLNILMPAQEMGSEPKPRYPLIVYIQGSAWMKQTMFAFPQLVKMAKKGYVIAALEYRESSVAPFPAQIEDTKTAIRYMQEHGIEYNADTSKIIVWGDSSGGHTALMTAVTMEDNLFDNEGQDENPIHLSAVIDYYGPTDISKMNMEPSTWDHMSGESPVGMFIGGVNVLENPDKVKPTIPMHYVSRDKPLPPILIAHGNKDRLVAFGQSVMMYDALKANDKHSVMYEVDNGDHGGAAFWSDEILNIVDEFIKSSFTSSTN